MPQKAPLVEYRSYLCLLARLHLDEKLRGKVDPSDIVQQTMLKALAGWENFRGKEDGQRLAWLRQILANTLANVRRDLHRGKRAVGKEVRLAALDRSSLRLSDLAGPVTSPSQRAVKAEMVLKLAAALEELPADQREAVARHYLLGETLAEVAKRLERSPAAAAGLVQRGLRKLRELLPNSE